MVQAALAVCLIWVKLPPTYTVEPTCAKARVSPSRACGVASAGLAETRVAVSGAGTTAAEVPVGTASTTAAVTTATTAARVRSPANRRESGISGTLRLHVGREPA